MTAIAIDVRLAWAVFVPRTILGFVYLFAGIHKIADPGPLAYGQAMAVTDGARFFPAALLTAVGTAVPFMEIALGVLLLLGLWARPALRAVALLVCAIAAGYGVSGLLHPVGATAMDIAVVNTFIMPRAALVITTLLLPAEADWFSVDGLRRGDWAAFLPALAGRGGLPRRPQEQ
jgi:uncharacterized membrane protein YphA (DoxX/SURF4 family)